MSDTQGSEIDRLRRESDELKEALRVATARLDALLEGSPVTLWSQDRDLRVTWAHNPMSREQVGDLMGLTDADYFESDEELESFGQIKRQVISTGQTARVVATRTIKGRKRHFDVMLKATRDVSENINGFSGVSYEVTDQILAREQLEDLDRRKDQFVALMAHELRAPLVPMRNLLAVLHEQGTKADLQDLAKQLDRQVGFMSRMIEDMLDFSRINNDKLTLRRGRFDLGLLIKRLVDPQRYRTLSTRDPVIRCELPDEPVMVIADLVRMGQLIGNLLENARKFTPAQAGVVVRLGVQASDVWVSVQDQGQGIAPDQLETISEPFAQADTSKGGSNDGLGLGLYLSRQLARMHGGSLVASSAGPGQGSTLTLHLPDCMAPDEAPPACPQQSKATEPTRSDSPFVAQTAAAIASQSVAQKSPQASSGVQMRKVLVVDDHEDSAQSMALLIDSWGFPVQVASNGREGLAKVLEWQPDVVFMDVRMPVMDGLEMARRIRTESLSAQPLLVALTGFGQKEDIERSLQAGANAHLVKPADPVRLKALIEAGRV